MALSKKLRPQLAGGVHELAKAALTLRELNECDADGMLDHVTVVAAEKAFREESFSVVCGQAERLLHHGVEGLNQGDIGNALQVLPN